MTLFTHIRFYTHSFLLLLFAFCQTFQKNICMYVLQVCLFPNISQLNTASTEITVHFKQITSLSTFIFVLFSPVISSPKRHHFCLGIICRWLKCIFSIECLFWCLTKSVKALVTKWWLNVLGFVFGSSSTGSDCSCTGSGGGCWGSRVLSMSPSLFPRSSHWPHGK